MDEAHTEIEDSATLTPSPGVTCERVGGEGILHDDLAGRVHVLNASATRVWELCSGSPTVAELTESLARSYELAPADVRADVLKVLTELRARGLLGASSEASPH